MEPSKNEKLLEKIFNLKKEGLSFKEISPKIDEEFDVLLGYNTIRRYHDDYIANSYVIVNQLAKNEQKAVGVVKDHSERIKQKFSQVDTIVSKLLRRVEEIMSQSDPEDFFKQTPTLLAVCREILSQLYFLKKEQEQLVINQKNIIYSPLQINQLINKELNNLEKYQDSDKIYVKEKTKKKFDKLIKDLSKGKPNGTFTHDGVMNLLVESYSKV